MDGQSAAGGADAKSEKRPFPWRAWFQASRPTFFVATVIPILVGHAAAINRQGEARPGILAMILIACFLVQLAANMSDDLFEHLQGVDSSDSIGGSRVIQEGKITPRQLGTAVFTCFLAAGALAIPIAGRNLALWLMAVFGALSSVFYVCPPVKYGHRGLGEVSVFINMGMIMTVGTQLALTGVPDPAAAALAVPVSLMVAGVLFYQSIPEIETDAAVGKRTLAVILGKSLAPFLHMALWPVAWLLMVNLWLAGLAAWPVLLGAATMPIHYVIGQRLRKAFETDEWLVLDKSGPLIRLMYLVNGILLIISVHMAR